MKRTLLIWASMACMTVHSVMAQDAAVNKIIEIGQTDNQVMDHLDVLTNRIGGRVIGSNAYDNAVEWVASKFTEWGLEVELQEAGTLPVGFNRGPWFGKLLGENGMELHFVTPSYTAGTKGVQRGHVLQEPLTQSEFDRMKGLTISMYSGHSFRIFNARLSRNGFQNGINMQNVLAMGIRVDMLKPTDGKERRYRTYPPGVTPDESDATADAAG